VDAEVGLRDRKKQQTRERISNAAWQLFVERGFERVTVAEVATAADVSEATVFNYFPTKEDLAYHRMADYEEAVLTSIRDRAPGTSLVQAFGRVILEPRGFLHETGGDRHDDLAAFTRMFAESPALLAREREIFDRFAHNLATLIAEDRGLTPDDVEARTIANALVGLQRALVEHVRRRVLDGVDTRRIAREVRVKGGRALSLLLEGLDV
jgi:AcrR family transcriptional regulator